jgi:hypothetical protein
MDDDLRQKIEEITRQMECPKDFKCLRNGLEGLCEARDFGLKSFIYCLEDNPTECRFARDFGFKYICICPLRVFVAKKTGK